MEAHPRKRGFLRVGLRQPLGGTIHGVLVPRELVRDVRFPVGV